MNDIQKKIKDARERLERNEFGKVCESLLPLASTKDAEALFLLAEALVRKNEKELVAAGGIIFPLLSIFDKENVEKYNAQHAEIQKAIEYYGVSAKGGYMPAWYGLGQCYANGLIEKGLFGANAKGKKMALACYLKAARGGYEPAQFELGRIYEKGELGVTIDYNEALRWYGESERNGNTEAGRKCSHLSLLSLDADDLFAKGVESYQKMKNLCEKGDKPGWSYFLWEAERFFKYAREKGSDESLKYLGLCAEINNDKMLAMRYFLLYVSSGYGEPDIIYKIGCFFGSMEYYDIACRWFMYVGDYKDSLQKVEKFRKKVFMKAVFDGGRAVYGFCSLAQEGPGAWISPKSVSVCKNIINAEASFMKVPTCLECECDDLDELISDSRSALRRIME